MATLIYVWDTIEERRAIVCRRHYDSALDAVEKLRGSAPDAVADLRVLVTI